MTEPLSTYTPKDVTPIISGIILDNFEEASAVRDEDAWNFYAGSGGDVTCVENSNEIGRITVSIPQTSPKNAALSALALAKAVVSATLIDKSGISVHSIPQGRILKVPDSSYPKSGDPAMREWVVVGNMPIHAPGGNA